MSDYAHAHGYDRLTDAELMAKVRKGWQSQETPCGAGSELRNTGYVSSALSNIAARYDIATVSDAGAGDLNWIGRVHWNVEYRGFDLYPRHPDVVRFDITKEVLPKSDLILCRHVLNHLSVEMSERAVALFRESGSRYLAMTMCDNQRNYWNQYKFRELVDPIETFTDCQHWRLELYDLLPA